MQRSDKFLMGIVVTVVLLVIVAFTAVFLRPKPTYQTDDTPEGVAHNYLLALRQGDYTRAYGYLSPRLTGYPDSVEAFEDSIQDYGWNFNLDENSVALEVISTRSASDERTRVSVRERHFYRNGLFDSNAYTTTFDITLRREAGQWKIVTADAYWIACWEEASCQ